MSECIKTRQHTSLLIKHKTKFPEEHRRSKMTVPSIQWTMQKYSHSCNTVGPHHYCLKIKPPFIGVQKSVWVESVDLTWLVALQCQNDADSSLAAWRVLLCEDRDFFAGAETVGSSMLHAAAIAVTFRASVAIAAVTPGALRIINTLLTPAANSRWILR